MTEPKNLKKIKSGLFDRSLSLTKLAIRSGAGIAASSIKCMLSDSDTKEAYFKILLESQAKLLAKELGTDSLQRAKTYLEDPLRLTVHLIMSTPEYQLV